MALRVSEINRVNAAWSYSMVNISTISYFMINANVLLNELHFDIWDQEFYL